jgi:hypothetical protein
MSLTGIKNGDKKKVFKLDTISLVGEHAKLGKTVRADVIIDF